jgi:hypothetical protein
MLFPGVVRVGECVRVTYYPTHQLHALSPWPESDPSYAAIT